MTRIPFDQLSKQFLEEFLTPFGTVERSVEVLGESRFVDIWFVPSPQPVTQPVVLGLLSRIAVTPCLIEPFRNQPTLTQVRNCLLKLLLVQADFQRKARRDEESIKEAELPQLWIFALIELITVFSARLYGSRSKKNKKLIDGMTQVVKEVA